MNIEQLRQLEAELEARGYRKFTVNLTDRESWAWFKSFDKPEDDEAELGSLRGYQVAFRVWDCHEFVLNYDYKYALDFWTSPISPVVRMDFTANWEPFSSFDEFERMAADFYNLYKAHVKQ